jgi:hypothetical protein
MSNNLLTQEESQHKVLDAKGIECDEKISKLSEEKLIEILGKRSVNGDSSSSKEELLYVNR